MTLNFQSSSRNDRYTVRDYLKDVRARVKDLYIMYVQCRRKKPIVFLEGHADYKLYEPFISKKAFMYVEGDKSSVLLIVEECRNFLKGRPSARQFAFGIVDLDYDHIEGNIQQDSEWLLYVDNHVGSEVSRDTEVMLIRSTAFEVVLSKYQITTDPIALRKQLLDAGAMIGAAYIYMRSLSETDQHLVGGFKELPLSELFDPLIVAIKLDELITYKFESVMTKTKNLRMIRDSIYTIYNTYDSSELSRGHDLTTMLALYICEVNKEVSVDFRMIETDLRSSLPEVSFWSENLGTSLQQYIERTSW